MEIIFGKESVYMEEILGKTFSVSTHAFLQVNIPQCEKIYKLTQELCQIDKDTIFLDICSGIGTIGICIAQNVIYKKLI